MIYEETIVKSHFTIRELQERVYEYLRDALHKEESEERLYEQLLESEN